MMMMINISPFNTSFYLFIVKTYDPDEILNLIELVVGVAVMCEDKATFIQHIFELDDISQVVLKDLIEQVLNRVVDISNDDNDKDDHDNDDNSNNNNNNDGNNIYNENAFFC